MSSTPTISFAFLNLILTGSESIQENHAGISNTDQFASIQARQTSRLRRKYSVDHGEPLFTLHMMDLSEEEKDWNIATMRKYLERAVPMKQWLKRV
ncbi:Fructose-bisphosphate aldolase 1 [Rhizina undulata]